MKCIEDNPLFDVIREGGEVDFPRYRHILTYIEDLYGPKVNLLSSLYQKIKDSKKARLNDWDTMNNLAQLLCSYLSRNRQEGNYGEPQELYEIIYTKLDDNLADQLNTWLTDKNKPTTVSAAWEFLDTKARMMGRSRFMGKKGNEDKKEKTTSGDEQKLDMNENHTEKSEVDDLRAQLAHIQVCLQERERMQAQENFGLYQDDFYCPYQEGFGQYQEDFDPGFDQYQEGFGPYQ